MYTLYSTFHIPLQALVILQICRMYTFTCRIELQNLQIPTTSSLSYQSPATATRVTRILRLAASITRVLQLQPELQESYD